MKAFQGAPEQDGFYWTTVCGRWEPVEVARLDSYGMIRMGIITIMTPDLFTFSDLSDRWFVGPLEPPSIPDTINTEGKIK